MFEIWKDDFSKGGKSDSFFTYLSKAFDSVPHNLFLAKPEAYGFNHNSLKLLSSFLGYRKLYDILSLTLALQMMQMIQLYMNSIRTWMKPQSTKVYTIILKALMKNQK